MFPAAQNGAPVHNFIHGGYRRSLDEHVYSHVAGPMVAAGATVVAVNYNLCPEVRIANIVERMRRAVIWIHKHAGQFNGDAAEI